MENKSVKRFQQRNRNQKREEAAASEKDGGQCGTTEEEKEKTYLAVPTSHQNGFVLTKRSSNSQALGNIALCKGCCGIVGPAGSVSPGIRSIEIDGSNSVRKESSDFVGKAE